MVDLPETVRRNIEAIVRLADLPDSSTTDILAQIEAIMSPVVCDLLDDPDLAPDVIEQVAVALRLGFEHGTRNTWSPYVPPTGQSDN